MSFECFENLLCRQKVVDKLPCFLLAPGEKEWGINRADTHFGHIQMCPLTLYDHIFMCASYLKDNC